MKWHTLAKQFVCCASLKSALATKKDNPEGAANEESNALFTFACAQNMHVVCVCMCYIEKQIDIIQVYAVS